MVLKHLENVKRTNSNRASFITLDEQRDEHHFAEIKEKEPAPEFVYMPTKLEMMTMIANAAYHN